MDIPKAIADAIKAAAIHDFYGVIKTDHLREPVLKTDVLLFETDACLSLHALDAPFVAIVARQLCLRGPEARALLQRATSSTALVGAPGTDGAAAGTRAAAGPNGQAGSVGSDGVTQTLRTIYFAVEEVVVQSGIPLDWIDFRVDVSGVDGGDGGRGGSGGPGARGATGYPASLQTPPTAGANGGNGGPGGAGGNGAAGGDGAEIVILARSVAWKDLVWMRIDNRGGAGGKGSVGGTGGAGGPGGAVGSGFGSSPAPNGLNCLAGPVGLNGGGGQAGAKGLVHYSECVDRSAFFG
jgi:hypothetical protein